MRTPDLGRDERAPFPAKITARTSSGGRYYYSWTEQVDAPAGYMDAAPARSGNATMNPAFEVNNSSVSTGAYVRMWLRSGQGGGGRCYEFAAPASAGSGIGVAAESGSPVYSGVTFVTLDDVDGGLTLTQPGGAGTAFVGMALADYNQVGVVGLGYQVMGSGTKGFDAVRLLTGSANDYTKLDGSTSGAAFVYVTVSSAQVCAFELRYHPSGSGYSQAKFTDVGGTSFEARCGSEDKVLLNGAAGSIGFEATSTPRFLVGADAGASGTDALGNVFVGGMAKTVGGGTLSGGTVTSVGLSLPAIFTTSGSPVTTSGTLTATLNTQSANLVFAGPAAGGPAAPTFRALEAADLPAQAGGWVTITLSYLNFSTGSTTHIYTPSTLPAKTVVHAVVVRTTTAFSGGAIGAYNLDVGLASGSGTEWCSGYDVMAAPSGTNFNFHPGSGATGVLPALLNPVSGVNIAITANCVGANLNAATQGTVEVSLFLSRLP